MYCCMYYSTKALINGSIGERTSGEQTHGTVEQQCGGPTSARRQTTDHRPAQSAPTLTGLDLNNVA